MLPSQEYAMELAIPVSVLKKFGQKVEAVCFPRNVGIFPHSVKTQKTNTDIFTAMRTSNLVH
jgi:hypothetical protein